MSGQKNYGFVEDSRNDSYSSFSAAISSTEQLTHKSKDNSHTVELKDLRKSLEAGEYDPFDFRDVEHPTTNFETLLHLLKGSLGTGILAMPMAFYHSGYVIGVIATACIGLLCTYCIHMLIKCEYELCKRRKIGCMSYPVTAECAFLEGPPLLQKLAPYMVHITNAFLLLYQLGTCCVYTVFIGDNIQKVLKEYVDGVDERLIMLAFLLPLILINYIRNLKLLVPLSSIANVLTFISFGIILYYLIKEDITIEDREPVGNWRSFPLFFGTVLFALEAIGVIMPLENEMKTPKSFGGTCGVLNIGMISIIIMYLLMGLFGYLAYGSKIQGSISYSLNEKEIPAQVAKILLALTIFISHSLQMYVAIDITWNQYLYSKLEKNRYKIIYEYLIRTFLVIICFCLAVAVPYIDLFISLFGALCLSALGLAFPAIIDTSTYWDTLKGARGALILTKNFFIVIFAICGLVVGTSTSLEEIVKKFSSSTNSTA
uniref:Proton-coupled amino acid transporter 4 n=1 Tax=Anoplophora glabripennis TaxID=217634 RepID=V5I8Q8_ANOGL